jgi:3-hydroxyacyl-[acyl-carrier-protein] dehydratase
LVDGTATLRLAPGHTATDGHFPGNPIIPGAVLLREVIEAIAKGTPPSAYEIRFAKFHYPVRPGDTLVISWRQGNSEEVRFSCAIEHSRRLAVTGALHIPQP